MTPEQVQLTADVLAYYGAIFAVVILLGQFIYRYWDKQDTDKILKENKESTEKILTHMSESLAQFYPHESRTKNMEKVLEELARIHSVSDEDGRLLIYMPKSLVGAVTEIAKLNHAVATTQGHIVKLLEKFDENVMKSTDRLEALLVLHGDSCKSQFNTLDKKFKGD